MTYNWNLNKARKQLAYLEEKLQSSSMINKDEILAGIAYLKYILKYHKSENDNEMDIELNISNLIPYARTISKVSSSLNKIKFYDLKLSYKDQREEETLYLVEQFYKSLNKNWYNLFKKIFNERKDNLSFSNGISMMCKIPELDYFYISVRKTNDVNEECTAVHEYAHTISYLMNPDLEFVYYNQVFTEVPSLFMQLISAEFFKEESFTPIEYDIHQKNIFNIMLLYCDEIHNNYYSKILKTFDPIERDYALVVNKDVNKLNRFTYAISYLIAIELFNIYQKDKERAIYYLDTIIKMQDEESIIKKLENMDIYLGNNIEKYHNNLIKKLKKSKVI